METLQSLPQHKFREQATFLHKQLLPNTETTELSRKPKPEAAQLPERSEQPSTHLFALMTDWLWSHVLAGS